MEENNSVQKTTSLSVNNLQTSFSKSPVTAERLVSFDVIVRSEEPSLRKLATDDYPFLFKFVNLVLADYFSFSHPNLSAPKIVERLAADLIETRPTWKAADFVNMCKFFRQNSHLIKTQASMTPELFACNVMIYEEHRAIEFEKFRQEEHGKHKEENRIATPLVEKIALKLKEEGKAPTGDRRLGKLAEQAAAEGEKDRTVFTGDRFEKKQPKKTVAPDENYFKQV